MHTYQHRRSSVRYTNDEDASFRIQYAHLLVHCIRRDAKYREYRCVVVSKWAHINGTASLCPASVCDILTCQKPSSCSFK